MVKGFFSFLLLVLISCAHKSNQDSCKGFVNGAYRGNAAIFFHKPVSGSTYQLFIVPVCEMDTLTQSGEFAMPKRIAGGVSFNLPSDDERLKSIYRTAHRFSLNERPQLEESLRNIYCKLARVDILFTSEDASQDEQLKQTILTESGAEIKFKYRFLSMTLRKFSLL